MGHGHKKTVMGLGHHSSRLTIHLQTVICIDTDNSTVRMVVDGQVIADMTIPELKDTISRSPLTLENMQFGDGLKLTDLQVYSSPMSIEGMQTLTEPGGICSIPGDFLAWEDLSWDISSVWDSSRTVEISRVTEKIASKIFIFP